MAGAGAERRSPRCRPNSRSNLGIGGGKVCNTYPPAHARGPGAFSAETEMSGAMRTWVALRK